MTAYSSILTYLFNLQYRGMKFGLRNIRFLLESVGNPESKFPSIHIAGTNGKGSTAAFLSSILMEAGFRTASYTSPHLERFTERIRINGSEIPRKRLADYVTALRPAIEQVHATFFEATTCIAFQYFADEGADVAVIEAGLGGRLDSTNTVIPMVSVITNVGLDHTEILGKTIGAIAREKAGIIKAHVPCVTSSESPVALRVLRRTARRKNSRLHQARRTVRCIVERLDPPVVTFRSSSFSIRGARLGLTGLHQILNAQLAVATMEAMGRGDRKRRFPGTIGNSKIKRGLENITKNSGLRGRLERVGRSPRFVLDVAHNPAGMRALVQALRLRGYDGLPVVLGVMKDKDYPTMITELASISRTIIAVAPSNKRALNARLLLRSIRKQGIRACYGGTVRGGLTMAKRFSKGGSLVLITGSHYVVGEALQALNRKKA